jgi:hypothetical protein
MCLYDISDGNWILLAGRHGEAWCPAAEDAPLIFGRAFRVGHDFVDVNNRWQEAYGVSEDGAVLIRPDNFVAWRSRASSKEPGADLAAALRQAAFLRS